MANAAESAIAKARRTLEARKPDAFAADKSSPLRDTPPMNAFLSACLLLFIFGMVIYITRDV
jgi:hypothetical protein